VGGFSFFSLDSFDPFLVGSGIGKTEIRKSNYAKRYKKMFFLGEIEGEKKERCGRILFFSPLFVKGEKYFPFFSLRGTNANHHHQLRTFFFYHPFLYTVANYHQIKFSAVDFFYCLLLNFPKRLFSTFYIYHTIVYPCPMFLTLTIINKGPFDLRHAFASFFALGCVVVSVTANLYPLQY
jgi:hypothetical protein